MIYLPMLSVTHTHTVDNLGMEGANIGVNERRPSAAVPPAWLEPKTQPYTNVFVAGSGGDVGEIGEGAIPSGMRSPTRLNAAAQQEAKSLEEGYRMNVPPKILINDPHDRKYYFLCGEKQYKRFD